MACSYPFCRIDPRPCAVNGPETVNIRSRSAVTGYADQAAGGTSPYRIGKGELEGGIVFEVPSGMTFCIGA